MIRKTMSLNKKPAAIAENTEKVIKTTDEKKLIRLWNLYHHQQL